MDDTRSFTGDIPASPNFPKLEEEILDFWEKERIFERSLAQNHDGPRWVSYDGPPGTNGSPHIGHMMQSALKDLWPRFKTMQGYFVKRQAGWDTHGLPVEQAVEAAHGFTSKADIEAYGIGKFLDACRDTVTHYRAEWESVIKRSGRFVDLKNAYATMDPSFIESDWWTLKCAHEKGLLYQGTRILPVSPKLETPLSNHEASSNYQMVRDLSCVVRFRWRDDPSCSFLAWTTTPWTLIGNVALALNPEMDYAFISSGDEVFVIATSRLERYKASLKDYKVIKTVKGKDLAGIHYMPLWSYFSKSTDKSSKSIPNEDSYYSVVDDYVRDDDGTGIVHLALYGEDDFRLIQEHKLPHIQHVGMQGRFSSVCGPYAGRFFRDTDVEVDIIRDLAQQGLLFHKERIEHSYPFCPRTGSPLLYFARKGWFLRISSLKEQLIEANNKIEWIPGHVQQGRFGDWLNNVVDWSISRERYWGSPLPIWQCLSCKHVLVVGSRRELNDHTDHPLPPTSDLHKTELDGLVCRCDACGGEMRRDPSVLDCWFNAGIMPWGQCGYPHQPDSSAAFNENFPADFICEGLDQTRGWFYTLLATSILVHAKSSYKRVMCTGLVRDAQGRKMSKSVGNVVAPQELFDEIGADACRWQFFRVRPGNPTPFGKELARESVRLVLLPLWHAFSFLTTYARADNWSPKLFEDGKALPEHELDRWLLSEVASLTVSVTQSLEDYDPSVATQRIDRFLDNLTNWYIRRSRRRFWKGGMDSDKDSAYQTLYTSFHVLVRLLAPFIPFTAEYIYQKLFRNIIPSSPDSVHLCSWPATQNHWIDEEGARDMKVLRTWLRLGSGLRKAAAIRVRQPLHRVLILHPPDCQLDDKELVEAHALMSRLKDYLLDELNVKDCEIGPMVDSFLAYKPNFSTLGPKFGKDMKRVGEAIRCFSASDYQELLKNSSGGTGSGGADSVATDSGTTGSGGADSVATDSGTTGSGVTGSVATGSVATGSVATGSVATGSVATGSGTTGSGTTGSGGTGSVATGSGTTGSGFDLGPEDVIEYVQDVGSLKAALLDNSWVIVLDTALSDELRAEGVARDVIAQFQKYRKDCGFDISDWINICPVQLSGRMSSVFSRFKNVISQECLISFVSPSSAIDDAFKPFVFSHDEDVLHFQVARSSP